MENFVLLVVLAALLVWMFISSRRRQQKMREEQALKAEKMVPGARVMTRSGLFGWLVEFDKDDLSKPAKVEVAPGVIVELHTQAVDLAPDAVEETATADEEPVVDPEVEDTTVAENPLEDEPRPDAPRNDSAVAGSETPEYRLPDLDLGDDKRDQGTDKKD